MRPTNAGARNPYTNVQFHKGYVHDKTMYRVLNIDQMDPKEKEIARGAIKILSSGPEAAAFVQQRHATGDTKWAYTYLDNRGDLAVLRRCGIAVALFYKRESLEYAPGPGEPLPESPITDPADVWQRLDIIGPSARRANFFVKREVDTLRGQNDLLTKRVDAKQTQIDGLESEIFKLNARLEARDKDLKELRERVSDKHCVRCHQDMIKKKKAAEAKIAKAKADRMAKILAREEAEKQKELAEKKAARLKARREKLNAKRIAAGLPPKDYGAKKKKSKRGKKNVKKAKKGAPRRAGSTKKVAKKSSSKKKSARASKRKVRRGR